MTTGRINQVRALPLSPHRKSEPPDAKHPGAQEARLRGAHKKGQNVYRRKAHVSIAFPVYSNVNRLTSGVLTSNGAVERAIAP